MKRLNNESGVNNRVLLAVAQIVVKVESDTAVYRENAVLHVAVRSENGKR